MKQVVINIPENKYLAFIKHIKGKFGDVQIKEKKSKIQEEINTEDTDYEIMLLSEKSLAEDWLSVEDNRWDNVLYSMSFKRGDIVTIGFPFSDMSDMKKRPALIISNEKANSTGDYLMVQMQEIHKFN